MAKSYQGFNWKEKSREWRKRLRSKRWVVAAMYDQWLSAKYDYIEREDEYYTDEFENALDALKNSIEDICSYPPPEILLVINDQYNHYLENGGSVSLEEAFFGNPKGRGAYAARRSKHSDSLYAAFFKAHKLYKSQASQGEFLSFIASRKHLGTLLDGMLVDGKEVISNPLYGITKREDFDLESFLRGYRRWKKRRVSP